MGSVNTWRTFEHALADFRYFLPMSGAITSDGAFMSSIVENSGYTGRDFFIYAMTGTEDFAYQEFKAQIDAMAAQGDGTFVLGNSEAQGNLAFRVRTGGRHDLAAANEYTYNGLRFFWNRSQTGSVTLGAQVLH